MVLQKWEQILKLGNIFSERRIFIQSSNHFLKDVDVFWKCVHFYRGWTFFDFSNNFWKCVSNIWTCFKKTWTFFITHEIFEKHEHILKFSVYFDKHE